jgi:hypothetical protein
VAGERDRLRRPLEQVGGDRAQVLPEQPARKEVVEPDVAVVSAAPLEE